MKELVKSSHEADLSTTVYNIAEDLTGSKIEKVSYDGRKTIVIVMARLENVQVRETFGKFSTFYLSFRQQWTCLTPQWWIKRLGLNLEFGT